MRKSGEVHKQVRSYNNVLEESNWNSGSKVHDENATMFLKTKGYQITPKRILDKIRLNLGHVILD